MILVPKGSVDTSNNWCLYVEFRSYRGKFEMKVMKVKHLFETFEAINY